MVRDFKREDWVFELSSGYRGFRNLKTNEWKYESDYFKLRDDHKAYLYDYNLLSCFRAEHLPFGEYPEIVLQDFLNKRYDKDNT